MIIFEDVRDVSCKEYFSGEQFACDMFQNKYSHIKENGDKETPAEVFYRVASGLLSDKEDIEKCFSLMYEGWVRPGGSILQGVGSSRRVSTMNCTTVPLSGDSLEDISKCDYDIMKCAAFRQGIGFDASKLRPEGSKINNAAEESTGVIPWINKIVDNGKYVGQRGRVPALLVSLSDTHPDIFTFIKSKTEKGQIENANISVQISDKFMEAVKADADWELRFDFDNGYDSVVRVVKAKEIFDLIAETAYKSAEPGVQFRDQLQKGMMVHQIYEVNGDERFKGISSNACLPEFATVLTKTGIRKFKDVGVGDIIWSGTEWTKIKRKWATGIKDVYEYLTTSGRFVGTEDHKIFQDGERFSVSDADGIDICVGPDCGDVSLIPEIIMDGLVIGDGSVHKASNNLVYLCIGENDTDYFKSEISGLILKDRTAAFKVGWEIETSVKSEELPFTYLRTIPDRFYYGDNDVVCSFLRGLYSANGGLCGDRVALKQSSFELIKQVQEMLSSVGIASYITTNKPKRIKFSNGEYDVKISYDLNITGSRKDFCDKIGFIQHYKQTKLKMLVETKNKPTRNKKTYEIIGKNYIGEYPVWDIEVEASDHRFWTGCVLASNCSEKFLPPYGICNLNSINMEMFDVDEYKQQLQDIVPYVVRMADSVVDYELKHNLSPLPEQRWVLEQTREIGCGITNIHGWLMKQNLAYDSDEGIDKVADFWKEYTKIVFQESVRLGEEKGNAPAYDRIDPEGFMGSSYYSNMINAYYDGVPVKHMRNLAHISVAPTGSLSNTFPKPCVSSGVEPVIAPYYWRKTRMQDRNKYQYYFIIPNRIQEFIMANLEKDSDDYERMVEFSGSVLDEDGSIGKEYIKIIDRNLPKGFFKPSHDIDYSQKVKLMARLYEWMESSISCTFNLPKTSTVQDVKNIYMAAYDHKVRAVSVYVDGSREGILVTEFPQETSICTENRPVDICYNCAPKRPKELPCNIHQVSVKGERWVVLVGMFNDKPFEIFCGAVEDIYLPQKCNEGSIVKQGNGKYSLKVKIRNSDVVYEDIADVLMSDNEKALTRLLSLNLRHGVYIQFIVDQLKKSKGDITSFSTAISRVLGKYVIDYVMKDNTCPLCGKASLSFDEGCIKCLECDYSRCD